MRLSKEDVALLRELESADGAGMAMVNVAPKAMFEFNLVNRLPAGTLQITKTGSRALFQAECIDALEQSLAAPAGCGGVAMTSGVERWLISSGFLHAVEKTVTARGKLWLASLSPDAQTPGERIGAACPEATSADFAARRQAGAS